MADYNQIVDQIRAFLQASDQTRNARLEGLASDFAAACAEVNQRLVRCQRLVQQGLRSEAIQLAEVEPRLFDAMTTLDFAEREQWDELAGIYDLAVATRLSVEAGAVLNEAYGQEHPLQDLLRNHRKLATQRAALRTRIAVMRKLMAQDPGNPIWAEDLRSFDKARLRQIQVEAAEAARLQDVVHIKRLLAEVQQPAWLDPPPKSLVNGLAKAEAQLRVQQARSALADLEVRLNEAFTARDPIRGRAARQEWIAATAASPPEPDDPIWGRVGPALQWLEDEDRAASTAQAHELALAALGRALDEPDVYDPAELERLGQEVLRLGRGMPDAIKRRYAAQIRAVKAARSRRSRILMAAAAAGILLTIGAGAFMIWSRVRSGDAGRAASDIARKLDAGDLEGAATFVDNLEKADPALFNDPSLIKVRRRLREVTEQEKDRAERFQEAIKQAEHAPATSAEPKALKTARELARVDSEKQAVADLGRRLQSAYEEERDKREARLRPRLEAIGGEVEGIEKRLETSTVDPAAILASITDSRKSLDEVAADLPLAGEELQARATTLREKLDVASNRLGGFDRRRRLQQDITDAVAYTGAGQAVNFQAFAERLRAYTKAYPDEPRSRAFRETLKEKPLWEAAAAWNRLVGDWKARGDEVYPAEAARRVDACHRFQVDYRNFPSNAELAAYESYAKAIAHRRPGDGSPAAALRQFLSRKYINGAKIVKVRDSRNVQGAERQLAYYTPDQPRQHEGSLLFSSFTKLDKPDKLETLQFNQGEIASVEESPQSKIAARFIPILADQAKLKHWDTEMTGLVNAILHETGIDPILQVELLREVVARAGEGSEPFRVLWERVKSRLAETRVEWHGVWVNPLAPQLDRIQGQMAQVIQSLRDVIPTDGQLQAQRDQIERGVARTYQTVGWLAQERDGYHLQEGGGLPRDGDLVVFTHSGDRMELKKVGSISGNEPRVETSGFSGLAEGRPVFVIPPR